jgi:hypothetical protein
MRRGMMQKYNLHSSIAYECRRRSRYAESDENVTAWTQLTTCNILENRKWKMMLKKHLWFLIRTNALLQPAKGVSARFEIDARADSRFECI